VTARLSRRSDSPSIAVDERRRERTPARRRAMARDLLLPLGVLAMAKNIVVFSDGTGNSAIKGRGTNVFKLFESIDLNGHRTNPALTPQIAFYDDGVGTQNLRPLKIITGATGLGLSRNVRQLYKEVCRTYDPGDRIFLFGFSRGAFTVRSLAGLIGMMGLLDLKRCNGLHQPEIDTAARFQRVVDLAYRMCKRCYPTPWQRLLPRDPEAANRFRAAYCHREQIRIAFLGVWDTVDAVGLPFGLNRVLNLFYRFKFPDYELGAYVDRACHALAIDDERSSFHPLLWDERKETTDRIEQVWFAGAHSNVGGGYPKQGMSIVALDWMMRKAAQADLRFVETDREWYSAHASVDDQIYDPRAGLGIFYRWQPREIATICRKNGIERPQIHLSVLERIARGTDDYAPGNLPPNARVVITPADRREKDAAAKNAAALHRAKHVEDALRAAHMDRTHSLLAGESGAYALGVASYWVFLLSCLSLLGVLVWSQDLQDVTSLTSLLSLNTVAAIATTVWSVVSSPLETLAAFVGAVRRAPAVSLLAIGFVIAFVLGYAVDNRMSATFSKFWHRAQQELRLALKHARSEAQEKKAIDAA
jgi:uncharacterized protein (DUF2235 family)